MASLPPAIMTMTTIFALIALAFALSWTRIGRWGGGHVVMHLICPCHGCHCWCHLCFHSWDDSAKDNGRSDRQGPNPDIHGREEVGHHDPIGVEQKKKKKKKKKSITVYSKDPARHSTYVLYFMGTLPAVLYQEFLPSGSDVQRFLCSERNKPTPQILLF
jgi:hypothetical protein